MSMSYLAFTFTRDYCFILFVLSLDASVYIHLNMHYYFSMLLYSYYFRNTIFI